MNDRFRFKVVEGLRSNRLRMMSRNPEFLCVVEMGWTDDDPRRCPCHVEGSEKTFLGDPGAAKTFRSLSLPSIEKLPFVPFPLHFLDTRLLLIVFDLPLLIVPSENPDVCSIVSRVTVSPTSSGSLFQVGSFSIKLKRCQSAKC